MAKLVVTTNGRLPVYFDVSAAVGSGGANLPEDVLLVTWLMRRLHDSTTNTLVQLALGSFDVATSPSPQLVNAITEVQKLSNMAPADGRVSPGGPFIQMLNKTAKDANEQHWPRLDRMRDGHQVNILSQRLLCGTRG